MLGARANCGRGRPAGPGAGAGPSSIAVATVSSSGRRQHGRQQAPAQASGPQQQQEQAAGASSEQQDLTAVAEAAAGADPASVTWRAAERPWATPGSFQDASFTLEVRRACKHLPCIAGTLHENACARAHAPSPHEPTPFAPQDEASTAAVEALASCCAIADATQPGSPLLHVSAGFESLSGTPACELVGASCLKVRPAGDLNAARVPSSAPRSVCRLQAAASCIHT
jgi:hypothetical protein